MNQRPYITCRQLIDFIAAYAEGELTAEESADFERHLAVCPSCRAYLDSYRKTAQLARAAATEDALDDVPEELIGTILARVKPAR